MGLSLSMVSGQGEERYRVDAASSEVHFSLGAWDGPVKGAFRVTSGEFTLNATSGAMTGTVNVDATSGRSGNDGRDKDMRSKQLKAQTYSTISFSPTKFSGQVKDSGDSAGQVEGNFTLLGQSHPITVPMTVNMDGDRFTATGSFTIPYVSWGVKDPSWLVMKVDKEVKIELKLIGSLTR
jgi:polyisoprenoid-binding protein YceI